MLFPLQSEKLILYFTYGSHPVFSAFSAVVAILAVDRSTCIGLGTNFGLAGAVGYWDRFQCSFSDQYRSIRK